MLLLLIKSTATFSFNLDSKSVLFFIVDEGVASCRVYYFVPCLRVMTCRLLTFRDDMSSCSTLL